MSTISFLVDFTAGDKVLASETFHGEKVLEVGRSVAQRLLEARQQLPGLGARVSGVTWGDGGHIGGPHLATANRVVGLLLEASGLLPEDEAGGTGKLTVPTFKVGFADGDKLLATKVIRAGTAEELSKTISKFYGIARSKFPDAQNLKHVMLKADLPDGTALNSVANSRVMSDLTKVMQALVRPSGSAENKPMPAVEPAADATPKDDTEEPPQSAKAEEPPQASTKPEAKPEATPDADSADAGDAEAEPEAQPKPAPAKQAPAKAPAPAAAPAPKDKDAEPADVNAHGTTTAPKKSKDDEGEDDEGEDDEKKPEVEEAAARPETGPWAAIRNQASASGVLIRTEEDKLQKALVQSLKQKPGPDLAQWWNKDVKRAFSDLLNALQTKLYLMQEGRNLAGIPLAEDAEDDPKDLWDIAVDHGFTPQHSGQDLRAKLSKGSLELWLTYESPIDILYKDWELKDGARVLAHGLNAEELETTLGQLDEPVKGDTKTGSIQLQYPHIDGALGEARNLRQLNRTRKALAESSPAAALGALYLLHLDRIGSR